MTRYEYDARNRVLFKREAWGDPSFQRSTEYHYDAVDNLTDVIAPRAYDYDLFSSGWSDADPRQVTTHYSYDVLNRKTSMTESYGNNAGLGHDSPMTQYRYDPVGNL